MYIFAYLNIYMCIIVYLYLNICIWWDTWKSTKTYVGCFKQDMCCFSHCRCIYLYIMHHCCIIIFEIIFTVCPFNITIANSKWNETSCSSMPLSIYVTIYNYKYFSKHIIYIYIYIIIHLIYVLIIDLLILIISTYLWLMLYPAQQRVDLLTFLPWMIQRLRPCSQLKEIPFSKKTKKNLWKPHKQRRDTSVWHL